MKLAFPKNQMSNLTSDPRKTQDTEAARGHVEANRGSMVGPVANEQLPNPRYR
jgi:hypothetical protein